VHPNGRFVYLTNRNQGEVEFEGKKVFNGGENNVAVFAIDAQTGEPNLVQTVEGQGIHLRTFGIDPTGHSCSWRRASGRLRYATATRSRR
jgi:6-phosphogluconolactonase (cycloisomerase 2 family)